jgi:hypothetical protein
VYNRMAKLKLKFGRATWGGSGALYPQSATAGWNSRFEVCRCRVWPGKVVKKTGSCAMKTCELRQVREEAAVSKPFHVPRGNLVGANCLGNACNVISMPGARPNILKNHGFSVVLILLF